MKRVELLIWIFFLSFLSPVQASPGSELLMNADTAKALGSSMGVNSFGHWNYKIETAYLEATPTGAGARSVMNVTYYDGFLRKLQEVMVQASPDKTTDIVVPHAYGILGRVEREYLPYVLTSKQGGFHQNALETSNWNIYGSAEAPYAYTLINYEGGLYDRVKKRMGPGSAWHMAGKGVVTTYDLNEAGKVRHYRVSLDGTLTLAGTYPAGVLRLTTVTDEDGKSLETYTDGQNREILSVDVDGTTRLETYSVYDDRGLLRYVLSPEASAQLGTTIDETVLQRLAYRYDYDRRERLVEKHLPGSDPLYMVYDKKDRLVLSQDGKQRAENAKKWSYSLYDGKNRVVETGEVVLTTATTHASLQTAASSSLNYTPAGARTALQYTLYDIYTATANVPVKAFSATSGYATGYHKLVTGLLTSVKTRVLGTNTWLTSTMYYDDRCRVIQTVSDNLQGGLSRVDMKYDFVGNVVKQRESHQVSTSRTDVLESANEYDDRGRLLSTTVKLNNGSPATTSYTYDAVGRLVKKKYGTVAETLTYNIRGWLTGKESSPFKMKLRYHNPAGGTAARWNGNISEWEWQHGTGTALMYGFTYDGANRLTGTTQKQKSGTTWAALTGSYLEKGITYDRNGNIKTLQRTANGTTVDNLAYTYTGNRLTGLTENVRTAPTGDIYSPGSAAAGTYGYDKNGNMINDSRRALNLSYNVLNLLSEVKTGSTVKAKYSYLADGSKLRVRDAGSNGFDYLGSLTYKSSSAGLQLEAANFGDGMILPGTSGQKVNYFLTDHLGSVRVIVEGNGAVKERNDYYPFGARHAGNDYSQLTENRFKYNGKEGQVTGGLGYLDYGWRMYDSGLGRWFGMDLMLENSYAWTPYRYGFDNPVNVTDVAGLWEKSWYGWTTSEPEDISRIMSMIGIEMDFYGEVSEAQYFKFIQEEYDGIGGRLSNGSLLLSEVRALRLKSGKWLYSPYDLKRVSEEIEKFGNSMFESNILSKWSFYTYKYYREKSWERMKSKFPIEALTGFAYGAVAGKLWGPETWLNLSNMRSYKYKYYGNQYVSSSEVKRMKSIAKSTSAVLKWTGKALGVYGLTTTFNEYHSNKLSRYGALYIGTADVLGLTNSLLGSGWSLGTSVGKSIVESNWYFDLVHGGRRW